MDSKRIIVDEIIDDVATIEDNGVMINVPLIELPDDIHDGSLLVFDGDGYHKDIDLEKEKREDLKERIERLKALRKDEESL